MKKLLLIFSLITNLLVMPKSFSKIKNDTEKVSPKISKETLCDATITGIKFIDDNNNLPDVSIANNGTYDLRLLSSSLSIEAITTGTLQSVTFKITGSSTGSRTENEVPYEYPASGLGVGTYTIEVKAFSQDNANGTLCDTKTFTITLIRTTTNTPSCNGSISSLRFFDRSGSSTVNITNNGTYSLSSLPTNFGIEALTTGTVGSVTFTISGSATANSTENSAPFTYPSSNSWPHGTGTFTITAKAYSSGSAGGNLCDTDIFTITITGNTSSTDCACAESPNNPLLNPSFENTVGSEWEITNADSYTNAKHKECGDKAIIVGHNSGTAKIRQRVNISTSMPVGASIKFTAYAGTHTNGQTNGCSPQLIIEYYKADNSSNGTATPTRITRNVNDAPVDRLAKFTVEGTIPANTAYIKVGGSMTCDYIKMDAVCLEVLCVPVTAGSDGVYEVCDNSLTQINLFDYITGEQPGGVWTLNGQVVSNLLTPSAGTSIKEYIYTVTGTLPCGNDESKVTVKVTTKPNAGSDGSYEVCSNALISINLNDYITGEQSGGTWTLNGQPVTNPFTPIAGTSTTEYTYTVIGTSPCGNDISKVIVKVYPTPQIIVQAGPDGEVCAGVVGQRLENGSPDLTTVKKYTLNGSVTGATSTLWSAYLPGDASKTPVGSFDDPTKLNAIFTPPIGQTTIVLRLTSNDPDGPCSASFDELILTQIACAGILDPCSCNEVTYSANEIMEVKDFIEIDGTPGQEWTLVVNGGGSNPLNGGAPYGTMQGLDPARITTTNINLPIITTKIPEVSPGIYRLDFAHDSGVGYYATVRNTTAGPTGGQELSVKNYCVITTFTPDISISGTICETSGAKDLKSVINDPNPPVVGVVTYSYTVNGGTEIPISTKFDPAGLAGATIRIYAKYTPETGNIIDCEILRDATGNIAVTTCALPVNLITFDGKVINDQVMLNWKISEEKNFSHFEVEHTTSGTEFGSIGKVFANGKNYFNYADNSPEKGDNYYRLKMVDLDGSFKYSKIVNINFEKNKNFVNVENPSVDGSFTISTNLKNPSFSLLSSNGSKIETTTISNGSRFIVKPANVVAGLYFLNIISEGKVVTKKVIVR